MKTLFGAFIKDTAVIGVFSEYCVYRRIEELGYSYSQFGVVAAATLHLIWSAPCHHLSGELSVSGPTEFFAARLQYNEDHY